MRCWREGLTQALKIYCLLGLPVSGFHSKQREVSWSKLLYDLPSLSSIFFTSSAYRSFKLLLENLIQFSLQFWSKKPKSLRVTTSMRWLRKIANFQPQSLQCSPGKLLNYFYLHTKQGWTLYPAFPQTASQFQKKDRSGRMRALSSLAKLERKGSTLSTTSCP